MTMQRDPEQVEKRYLHDFVSLAGKRVLEVGCGEGRLTWRYADIAGRVTGIDTDPERLAAAPRDCPPDLRRRVGFALAQAEALPFAGETFDVAILAWSL